MKPQNVLVMGLAVLLGPLGWSDDTPSTTLPKDGAPLGPVFNDFARAKYEEIGLAARRMGAEAPSEIRDFFQAVASNHWSRAEYVFTDFRRRAREQQRDMVGAALSTGMHDVTGVYDLLGEWPRDLADLFAAEALAGVPDGSVILGGTSEGRFFITFGAVSQRSRNILVVTQNALADHTYAEYLRAAHAGSLTIFSPEEARQSYETYVADVAAGRRDAEGSLVMRDGRPQIIGAKAVMDINGLLARRLFEANRDRHPFFVEESFLIDWMYEYLNPHGLILRLNNTPLAALSKETVSRDKGYWDGMEKRLLAMPGFVTNEDSRVAFAKCRCAIAGLYSFRKMTPEAESAFRQSVRLCPKSPEANFRLARFLGGQGEYDKAAAVMAGFVKTNPKRETLEKAVSYLEELKKRQGGGSEGGERR